MPAIRSVLTAWATGVLCLGAVLALLMRAQGLPVHAVLNATSQWLHGAAVPLTAGPDAARTGVGALTNVAACLFWAAVAAALHRRMPGDGRAAAWVAGLGTALAAIILDYGILPRAFSPGWHLVLPPAGVAAGFAAMGAGFALGLRIPDPHPHHGDDR